MKKKIFFCLVLLLTGFMDAGQDQSKPALPSCSICNKKHLVIGKIISIPGRGVMDRYCYLKKFTTKQPWMTPQDRVPYDQALDQHNHEVELFLDKIFATIIVTALGLRIVFVGYL